jgi:hypothetical protein
VGRSAWVAVGRPMRMMPPAVRIDFLAHAATSAITLKRRDTGLQPRAHQGSHDGTEEGANAIRERHGESAPRSYAQGTDGAPSASSACREPPQGRQESERRCRNSRCENVRGSEEHDQKGHSGSDGKRSRRRKGRLHGTCTLEIGNTEFIPSVGPESVVGHQLIRNLLRESRLKASGDIDTRQFRSLRFVLGRQLMALERQVRFLCVRLGTHRDVLTGGHGHGASNEAGYPGDDYVAPRGPGGCDAHDETGR